MLVTPAETMAAWACICAYDSGRLLDHLAPTAHPDLHRRRRPSSVAAFVAGLLLVVVPGVAHAAGAKGQTDRIGPYAGRSYDTWNTVVNSTRLFALTTIETSNGSNAPEGYMGVSPRLFWGNGSLCTSRAPRYSGGAQFDSPTQGNGCGTGRSYYSDVWSYAWNGSGYTRYNTKRSPSISF